MERARRVMHPFTADSHVSDDYHRAVLRVLTEGPGGIAKLRNRTLECWQKRGDALEARENALHDAIPEEPVSKESVVESPPWAKDGRRA